MVKEVIDQVSNNINIYNLDCLVGMKDLGDESVDLITTDPPYGINFMGKSWDKALPDKRIWVECLRVLKDGAFAFVMSIPRADCLSRMILSLEDAGFNVGFSPIYWAYASGFPKAQNIGKMVDKRLGAEREITGRSNRIIAKNPRATDYQGTQTFAETAEGREASKWLSNPATPQAKALDGSYGGFQPKPAVEVIIVAMKPLSEKTFVDQALKNRKGITWLDDCRIPYQPTDTPDVGGRHRIEGRRIGAGDTEYGFKSLDKPEVNLKGRFPANLLISDDVLKYNQREDNPNWRGGRFEKCVVCGKEFWLRPSLKERGRKTCSLECKYKYHSEWMSGENNPKWNGGCSGEYKKGKTDKLWREKRRAVYKRDNWTCQACGDRSGKLHAHHIIPWRLSFDDSIKNLISLCPSCHTKVEATWVNVGVDAYVPSCEGSFSRYFDLDAWYDKPKTFPFLVVPKASKSEKNRGVEGDPQNPFDRNSISRDYEGVGSKSGARRNYHPTVKPVKLFSYLVTLGSRAGDTVLDPFGGTMTTALACAMLGRKFIGYEIDAGSYEISEGRIRAGWQKKFDALGDKR